MVPPINPGGRKRTIDVPEILRGIFYVLWTGCHADDVSRGLGLTLNASITSDSALRRYFWNV
jgi:transposase